MFQIKLVNISSNDIVDGNQKLTLGLVWSIILHWQVSTINSYLPLSLLGGNQIHDNMVLLAACTNIFLLKHDFQKLALDLYKQINLPVLALRFC